MILFSLYLDVAICETWTSSEESNLAVLALRVVKLESSKMNNILPGIEVRDAQVGAERTERRNNRFGLNSKKSSAPTPEQLVSYRRRYRCLVATG